MGNDRDVTDLSRFNITSRKLRSLIGASCNKWRQPKSRVLPLQSMSSDRRKLGSVRRRTFLGLHPYITIFFVAVYLYVAGFSYRSYFRYALGFPLGTNGLDYTDFVYSYNAILSYMPIIGVILFVLFAYDTWVHKTVEEQPKTRYVNLLDTYHSAIFSLVALSVFPLIVYFARNSANHDVRELRLGNHFPPKVFLQFKPKAKKSYEQYLLKANSDKLFSLVSPTSDSYDIVYQPLKVTVQPGTQDYGELRKKIPENAKKMDDKQALQLVGDPMAITIVQGKEVLSGPLDISRDASLKKIYEHLLEKTILPRGYSIVIPKEDVNYITTFLPNDPAP